MSLKLSVKVSNITNLSNARYCAGMGVEYLGFDLNESSPNYISPSQFGDMVSWVTGVTHIGEFDSRASAADIKLATQNYKLDGLQIEDIGLLEELSELSMPIIFKVALNDEKAIERFLKEVDAITPYTEQILIASSNSDLYSQIDHEISSMENKAQWIRAFDVSLTSIETLLNQKIYPTIELQGIDEDRPGFNDYGDLMDILEVIEED